MVGGNLENGGRREVMRAEVRWRSWLVPLFVVANVVMFVVTMYENNCPARDRYLYERNKCVARFLGRFSFQPLRENPLFGPSASTLRKMGALNWNDVVYQKQGGGFFMHLASCGSDTHRDKHVVPRHHWDPIGATIWILSDWTTIFAIGFWGSILSTLFSRNTISVGASGALFGLLGAMLSELITNWTIYSNKAAALLSLVVIIVINLAVGILPQVDNFAHIGGFLSGLLLGFVLLMRPRFGWLERHELPVEARVKSKHLVYQYVLCILSLGLAIAGFTIGLVLLYRKVDPREHCSWCHYLTCVPSSRWDCPD